MAADQSFGIDLVRAVRQLMAPVEQGLEDSAQFSALLATVGWAVPPASIPIDQIRALTDFAARLDDLDGLLAEVAALHPEDLPSLVPQLASSGQQAVAAVTGLASLATTGLPAPFNTSAFWGDVATGLLDLCVFRYLEFRQPAAFGLLIALGIAREDPVDVGGASWRRNYTRRSIDWSLIGDLFTLGPRIQQTYAWGSATFNAALLLRRLGRLMGLLGRTTYSRSPDAAVLDRYYAAGNPARTGVTELRIPLVGILGADRRIRDIGLAMLPIPAASGAGNPVGVALRPWIEDPQASLALGYLQLTLRGGFQADDALAVHLRPGAFEVIRPGGGGGPVDAEVAFRFQPPRPAVLLGARDGTHLEVADIFAGVHVQGDPAQPEVVLSFGTTRAAVVLDLSQGDGLIASLLGSTPARIEFEGTLVWSSKTGFHFKGSSGLELSIPIGKTFAVVTLDRLLVALHGSTAGLRLSSAVSGAAQLGPVTVTVGGVGAQLTLSPRPAGAPPGTFGPIDITFGFTPPSIVGLTVDAVAVTGGGALFYDAGKQQYGGVLELEVLDQFSVKAIALLTTGAGSFSLMALVFVDDFTPIALGGGFTLNSVGGAIAINRQVALDALQVGLKNRALDGLLFPADPVRNAAQIISDLDRTFPLAPGRFVFGPMAKIAWGTPPLVTVDLALLLELPAPVRVVLLGRLAALLPTPETALIELHMDVLGAINFDRSELSLDATLHDSRLMAFTLSGDMALRAAWAGPSQGFVLAVGGVHPRFTLPPGFPALRRVTLALAETANPRIRLDAYLALTSNTIQFGAHLDLHAQMGELALAGQLSFDALFHVNPFCFIADFGGLLALSYDNQPILAVTLLMTLSGPSPWHARGRAAIDLAGYRFPAEFDVTFGEEIPQPAPLVADPHLDLVQAFGDPRNWTAQLPASDHMLVQLRQVPPMPTVLAHPLGELSVRERVLPLEVQISHIGGAPLAAPRTYALDLDSVRVNNQPPAARPAPVTDAFAPAQFRDLTDDEKLASPSFETYVSGMRFQIDQPRFTGARERPVQYRQVVVNSPAGPPIVGTCTVPAQSLQTQLARGAAARSRLDSAGRARFRGPRVNAPVSDTRYTVARQATLEQAASVSARTDLTMTQARDLLRTRVASSPQDAGTYQVVASHEAVAV